MITIMIANIFLSSIKYQNIISVTAFIRKIDLDVKNDNFHYQNSKCLAAPQLSF